MPNLTDYESGVPNTWCPGCGNFGILKALQEALVALELAPQQVLLVSGIGQAGKLPHYTRANVLNELHGRDLPAAGAAKLVNPALTVIAHGGDGNAYGEGANHLLGALQRNVDLTYIVHNNQIYGLTKGQASPTSDAGFVTKWTPHGAGPPVNPMALAIAAGGSFVARSFAGDPEHLSGIIQQAVRHPGFALVDVLQPCVSFNHQNTYQWYRERVYKLSDSYDPQDRAAAFEKAEEWGPRIPIGVIYRQARPLFEARFPGYAAAPPIRREINPREMENLLDAFV